MLVVDGSTLTEQARLPTALTPHVAFGADAPRAYVASQTEGASPRPGTRLTVIDTDRLMVEEQVDLPVSSGPAGLVVAPKPIAVQALTSQVSGRQVTLQWAAPDDRNRWAYRIEVGVTPGAVDLSLDVPANTSSYSVVPVPPGTYYVQIRSLNAVTSSAATSQTRIDVP